MLFTCNVTPRFRISIWQDSLRKSKREMIMKIPIIGELIGLGKTYIEGKLGKYNG